MSKSARFASLGVAGGDNEIVEGGEEVKCRYFFPVHELYVRWTLKDINFGARRGWILRRYNASLWLCLHYC